MRPGRNAPESTRQMAPPPRRRRASPSSCLAATPCPGSPIASRASWRRRASSRTGASSSSLWTTRPRTGRASGSAASPPRSRRRTRKGRRRPTRGRRPTTRARTNARPDGGARRVHRLFHAWKKKKKKKKKKTRSLPTVSRRGRRRSSAPLRVAEVARRRAPGNALVFAVEAFGPKRPGPRAELGVSARARAAHRRDGERRPAPAALLFRAEARAGGERSVGRRDVLRAFDRVGPARDAALDRVAKRADVPGGDGERSIPRDPGAARQRAVPAGRDGTRRGGGRRRRRRLPG